MHIFIGEVVFGKFIMKQEYKVCNMTCDRCKDEYSFKEINFLKKPNPGWGRIMAFEVLDAAGGEDRALIPGLTSIDLCPSCAKAFQNFIYRNRGVQGKETLKETIDARKLGLNKEPLII
jgi:hypothetical protein